VLRPADAGPRQRIVMVLSAPITLTCNRFERQRSTDLSIINLRRSRTCSACDVEAPRNDIRTPATILMPLAPN
jgi:hypothetical protein